MSTSDASSPNADLFAAALALDPQTRGELAVELLESLDPRRDLPDASSDEVASEVQRRSAEMDSGEVEGIPGDVVRAELRAKVAGSDPQ